MSYARRLLAGDERKDFFMARFSACLFAAPLHERVRGTAAEVTNDIFTVRTTNGAEIPITLRNRTRYPEVTKLHLDRVAPGSYLGTAAKSVGEIPVALEVVVFPPSMRGAGEGHYAWDRIPDTTLSSRPAASSTMTNGTVSRVSEAHETKKITLTYRGGSEVIVVPPTAPAERSSCSV